MKALLRSPWLYTLIICLAGIVTRMMTESEEKMYYGVVAAIVVAIAISTGFKLRIAMRMLALLLGLVMAQAIVALEPYWIIGAGIFTFAIASYEESEGKEEFSFADLLSRIAPTVAFVAIFAGYLYYLKTLA